MARKHIIADSVTSDVQSLRRSARLLEATSGSLPVVSDSSLDTQGSPKKKSKSRKAIKNSGSEFGEVPSKPLYKLSSMQFPSLGASQFGLAQEKLANEPFKVLVACIFLTRTKGTVSMPVCRELFRKYSTIEQIRDADVVDITAMLQPLGLHNQRARTIIKLATEWCCRPPTQNVRYRKLHYPARGDGIDISPSEQPIEDEIIDPRIAWEVAHLPGVGAYALDSWRIFCRDRLRGVHDGLLDVTEPGSVAKERLQEWTRVLPLDKELIAYVRWRWLRLGYLWDPVDGMKLKVDQDIVRRLQTQELKSYNGFDNPWSISSSIKLNTEDLHGAGDEETV